MKRPNSLHRLVAALAFASLSVAAQAADITVGYQTGIDPTKVPQADGLYEKAIGEKIDWRRFNSGPEVIAALASGDLQLGNIGSSPLAAATSRKLPIVAFIVSAQINAAEALVVRNGSGIGKPEDLAGKTIATPFVSTSHYSLLGALKHWQIDPSKVKIVNLNPAEIAAAWRRGDIDGAFVWSPALGEIKKSGKVLTDAAEVGQWGAPTFEVWVARKDFAEKHPEIVARFARVSLDSFADYNAHKAEWTADSEPVKKIARLTGADPRDVPELLAGSTFPESQAQLSADLLGGGTAKAIAGTAEFLKEQKRVPAVLGDYSPYVSADFVRQAEQVRSASAEFRASAPACRSGGFLTLRRAEHMSRLTAEAISLSFEQRGQRRAILRDLSLGLAKGESLVVLGPSGCGKSTLLNILAGFQKPDQGRVQIDGRTLEGPGGERGVVFQDDALMPWLNALENVALGLRIRGLGKAERSARARQVLQLVGLQEYAEQSVAQLSGGQRQRLGLARALAVEPDFLLLDEPFGALDALTRERMQVLLLDLWKQTGKGLFLITHSVDEALFLATDLVVMDGPPARIVKRLPVDFARRYAAGETVRSIKADPEFGRLRQALLDEFLDVAEAEHAH